MRPLLVFCATAVPSALVGYFIGRVRPLHRLIEGNSMRHRLARIFGWLNDPRGMKATVIVTAIAVVLGLGYSIAADQRRGNEYDALVQCIARYQSDQSTAQVERTNASARVSERQRDVIEAAGRIIDSDVLPEQGDVEDFRAAIRDYLTDYEKSKAVRQARPYAEFSLDYCRSNP